VAARRSRGAVGAAAQRMRDERHREAAKERAVGAPLVEPPTQRPPQGDAGFGSCQSSQCASGTPWRNKALTQKLSSIAGSQETEMRHGAAFAETVREPIHQVQRGPYLPLSQSRRSIHVPRTQRSASRREPRKAPADGRPRYFNHKPPNQQTQSCTTRRRRPTRSSYPLEAHISTHNTAASNVRVGGGPPEQ